MQREYANVFTRFAATIIDGLILVPFYIPLFVLQRKILTSGGTYEPDRTTVLINMIPLAIAFGFAIWNQVVRMGRTGQSLGKQFLGIMVVGEDGKPIGVGYGFLREWVGKFVSAIICYIGFLNAFWDEKKQGWHDKIAKSFVVYAPPKEEIIRPPDVSSRP